MDDTGHCFFTRTRVVAASISLPAGEFSHDVIVRDTFLDVLHVDCPTVVLLEALQVPRKSRRESLGIVRTVRGLYRDHNHAAESLGVG